MSLPPCRVPILNQLYSQYLRQGNSATFIRQVAQCYTLSTLHRLADHGNRITRRAAVLALTYLGGQESIGVIGEALRDVDRGVRLLAYDGIRPVWHRAAAPMHCHQLQAIMRLNAGQQLHEAVQLSSALIEDAPEFAEAWNQRAIGYFGLQQVPESIADCQQALQRNPYHFAAATGLGHGYLVLGDLRLAMQSFQHALQICPDLEHVRHQVSRLERSLEGL